MGCWLESKLVAVRWDGQVSRHDHSSTLKIGDNMMVRWSIVNREHEYMLPSPIVPRAEPGFGESGSDYSPNPAKPDV